MPAFALSAPEKNYATIENEFLWAVYKFYHYLVGAHFTLGALIPRAEGIWMVHKPGRVKQNADTLSRKLINLVGLCPALETLDLAQA